MTMDEWAKKEVELACAREHELAEKNGDPDGADYGCLCYESALKAYNSLMEDGHSGCSIGITKNILNRLIDGRPLFPIEDVEDVWNKLEYVTDHDEYQCKRMSSLFKEVDKAGNVTYSDIDRVTVCEIRNNKSLFYNGFISRIIHEMYPITMPYLGERYLIYIDEWTYTDKETSKEIDMMEIRHMVDRDKRSGEKIKIGRYFKEENEKWVEIDGVEYGEYLKKQFRPSRNYEV